MIRKLGVVAVIGLGLGLLMAGCEVTEDPSPEESGQDSSTEPPTGTAEEALTSDFLPYPWPSGQSYVVTQGNGGLYWNGASCVSGGDHTGLAQYAWDWGLPTGTPVLASKAGKVKMTQFLGTSDACYNGCGTTCPYVGSVDCTNRGNYVVIAHNDGTTQALYLHLSRVDVAVNATVSAGQQIGLSGTSGWSTGPHLHFMNSNVGSSYYSQSIASSFNGVAPACHASSTSSNTGGGGGGSPWCSSSCAGGGWWCWNDGGCIQNGVAGHNYHCPGNNTAPDRDQACALGCNIAAAGSPDYCKYGSFCGGGAWCGNDCVNGNASTLYNFTAGGALSSVTQCSVGYANGACKIAAAGSPDYCF
ncbi:MAG: M23 family metallopeptidase [Minicystis sp.]